MKNESLKDEKINQLGYGTFLGFAALHLGLTNWVALPQEHKDKRINYLRRMNERFIHLKDACRMSCHQIKPLFQQIKMSNIKLLSSCFDEKYMKVFLKIALFQFLISINQNVIYLQLGLNYLLLLMIYICMTFDNSFQNNLN